jgi:heme exporter protein D
MFGPHAGFILAAYAITFAVIAALAVWIVADGRRVRRRLAEMEARGITRRSARKAGPAAVPKEGG